MYDRHFVSWIQFDIKIRLELNSSFRSYLFNYWIGQVVRFLKIVFLAYLFYFLASLTNWKNQNVRAAWFLVSLDHSSWVPELAKVSVFSFWNWYQLSCVYNTFKTYLKNVLDILLKLNCRVYTENQICIDPIKSKSTLFS